MDYSIYHIEYGTIFDSFCHALISSSDEQRARSLLEKDVVGKIDKPFKRIVIKKLEYTGFKFPYEEIVYIKEYYRSEILKKFDISLLLSKS